MSGAVSATMMKDTATAPARSALWPAASMLWRREVVRFLRQRNRVIGALATPIVFWLLLGFGLGESFVAPGASGEAGSGYLAYFFPGTLSMIVLFTAIFSTISVIEDRNAGFLQAVLVSPAPRLSIALGKVLGGATLATLQGVLMLAVWPLVGDWPGWGAAIAVVPVVFLMGVVLTAMGLCFAWRCDSTAGFHAVMNLVLMPMWFLSGAMFPLASAPLAMRAVMYANPLTYGQSALAGLLGVEAALPVSASVAVLLGGAALLLGAATRIVATPRKDGT